MNTTSLISIILAAILGYIVEPEIRHLFPTAPPEGLVGEKDDDKPQVVMPPPETVAIDPNKLTAQQLPPTVRLKQTCQIEDKSSGLSLTLAEGSIAKLVRVKRQNVLITPPNTTLTVMVPIAQTDLLEQLQANPPKPASGSTFQTPPVPSAPVETPAAAAPAPELTAPAETAAESTPANPAEPTPSPAATTTDVVELMKESIRSGQIKEFTFDQVVEWKAADNVSSGGQIYQSGKVSYKSETPFGVKMVEAQAHILNGKVQRWIWPSSGIELK